jgi:hypothetical protein
MDENCFEKMVALARPAISEQGGSKLKRQWRYLEILLGSI